MEYILELNYAPIKKKQVIYEVLVLYKISNEKQADFFLLVFAKCSRFLAFFFNSYVSALKKTWKIREGKEERDGERRELYLA